MSHRMEAGLRTLVLALYDEAALTAAAKGLTGAMGRLAALKETAGLASGPAHRRVTEEEVLRVVLTARRAVRSVEARSVEARPAEPFPAAAIALPAVPAPPAAAAPIPSLVRAAPLRLRRGRLAALAMRSLARHPTVSLS